MVYVDLFATSQEGPVTRIRRFSLIAVLTAILLALGLPALAASPMSISDSVTDPDGWLASTDRHKQGRLLGQTRQGRRGRQLLGHGRRLLV